MKTPSFLFALLLGGVLLFGAAGCQSEPEQPPAQPEELVQPEPTPAPEPEAEIIQPGPIIPEIAAPPLNQQ